MASIPFSSFWILSNLTFHETKAIVDELDTGEKDWNLFMLDLKSWT